LHWGLGAKFSARDFTIYALPVSLINPLAKEISAKIVFYGPGLSGKTTSLKYLYSVIRPERRGELVTLATEGDRTLFFDFLPISIERVQDMPVRLQLYTVPGQIFYAATRKLVLNGADGVVFVADSQEAALDSNKLALQDLRDNLTEMGMELEKFPHLFQYNKRDLPRVMPVARMEAEFNKHKVPAFETCAERGTGVLNALREITRVVVRDMKKRQTAGRLPLEEPEMVAEDGLRERLSQVAQSEAASMASPTDHARYADISFSALWPLGDTAAVQTVETHIREHSHGPAVRAAAGELAALLDALPGATQLDGPMSKALMLGLDGRDYLRLCRLASTPDAAVTHEDALFSLVMLVTARMKQRGL